MKKDGRKNKVVIFGTGDLAQVAHFYLTNDSSYQVVAFTVDKKYLQKKKLLGLPVVPFEELEKAYSPEKFKMLVAVGFSQVNQLRAKKYFEAKKKGYELISYVCSKSVVWDDLKIGDNCFILENQTIQPFVEIGNNVVIWSGNHIGHHSSIGNHCFISSHVVIASRVTIEPYCFIGINAAIRDGITIAKKCVVGMGSIIVKDTQKKGVYIGSAAKLYSDDSSKIRL